MTYEEVISKVPEVRIIGNTFGYLISQKVPMVGKEYSVDFINYEGKTVCINSHSFKFSDVQFLTPVEYKGRKVGIGDEVMYKEKLHKVYSFTWIDDEWYLECAKDSNINDCYYCNEDEIENILPLYSPTPLDSFSKEEAIEFLEKKGWIQDGKIIS